MVLQSDELEDHGNTYVPQNIDDALEAFEDSNSNSAYKTFYEKQLEILKQENPNMRRNQYQDHIFKLWKRSAENPQNQ